MTQGPAPTRAIPEARALRRRRWLVLGLNLATIAALVVAMVGLMRPNGMVAFEWAMLVPFVLTLPWLSIGFWNAVIGFALDLRLADPAAFVTPALARVRGDEPVTARVAIVMPIRNETAEAAIARIAAVAADLATTPWAGQFAYHVLSDTDRPEIARREERLVAAWRRRAQGCAIHYRRRTDNAGFKAGNIAEFLDRCHTQSDLFIPLDADSVMGAGAVLRLVRVMQASPEIGMLQGLVVGTPATSFFTRAFQFGMRHGMRAYTLGSAFWQGDCGPSWGHNMAIRTEPFHRHCRLARLPGRGPLAGDILSHDQVEAALMRRVGYQVRVLAAEDESFEDNPPSLPDFIIRELRWCNGNLQYLRLLGLPGLMPLNRVQLALAILMYLSPAAWFAFLAMGAALAGTGDQFAGVSPAAGLAFFAAVMAMNLMPKLMGLGQVLADPAAARRYGGRGPVIAGGVVETVFALLTAPVVAFAVTVGVVRLMLGRRAVWDAQVRVRSGRLGWAEAARALWPQTLAGLAMASWLAATAPWALWFAAPVAGPLALAIPVAVLTTWPPLGALSRRLGILSIPEELAPTPAAPPAGALRAA